MNLVQFTSDHGRQVIECLEARLQYLLAEAHQTAQLPRANAYYFFGEFGVGVKNDRYAR